MSNAGFVNVGTIEDVALAASLVGIEQTLTAAVGPPPPTGEPLVHYSPGVDAHLAARRPLLPR